MLRVAMLVWWVGIPSWRGFLFFPSQRLGMMSWMQHVTFTGWEHWQRTGHFLKLNVLHRSENSHSPECEKWSNALADYSKTPRKLQAHESLFHNTENWNKTENCLTEHSSCFDRNKFCSFGIKFIQRFITAVTKYGHGGIDRICFFSERAVTRCSCLKVCLCAGRGNINTASSWITHTHTSEYLSLCSSEQVCSLFEVTAVLERKTNQNKASLLNGTSVAERAGWKQI